MSRPSPLPAALLPLALLAAPFLGAAPAPTPAPAAPAAAPPAFTVFSMPALHPFHRKLVAQFKQALDRGDFAAMETISSQAVERLPEDATWRYNLACSLARRGKPRPALDALEKAVRLGFTDDAKIAADTDLAILRRDQAFARLLGLARYYAEYPEKRPNAVTPTRVAPGRSALVSRANTIWNMEGGGFITRFSFPPYAPATETNLFVDLPGKTGERLRAWQLEGTAAGNAGDLYDNLDRGHSVPDLRCFPEVTRIRYCPEAVSNGLDNTGATQFNFAGTPVIGNSSTALTEGPMWRSIPRYAQEFTIPSLVSQYLNNQVYVYPQHHDYLPTIADDVYPSRTPYLYIAPGSSWSDRAIVDALFAALAALRPETKEALVRRHQLAPALRFLVHSSLKSVARRADYLTPAAHPPVLNGALIDTLRLVEAAHALTTNALPPLVALRLTHEEGAAQRPFAEYFDIPRGERLLDTPFAVARVFRGMAFTRRYTLEAVPLSPAADGMRFHWILFQGDPARVRILPLDGNGRTANVEIDYQGPVFGTPYGVRSSRVDIALVADDGLLFSPPAFFCCFFLNNEVRHYTDDNRILSVDYASAAGNYVDPQVSRRKDWRDLYVYDEDGHLTGWTRLRDGRDPVAYTADGERIVKADAAGAPVETARPVYAARMVDTPAGPAPALVEEK